MIDLKRLRKEKGITQKELAQLLSCGQSFIANVENGRRDLPPVKIEILGYSVCWCRRFFQAANTANEREADSTLFYDYRERKRDRTVK